MNSTHIFRLRRTDSPWGDYGDMLIHGMAERSESDILELERSGTFVPPISQPAQFVVVTDEFLRKLQTSGLKGVYSAPVIKKRVPLIDWQSWEPYGSKPWKYPAGGEPENYILRRKHSPKAADSLGMLWELKFQAGVKVSREGGYHLVADSWNGLDFFVVDEEYKIYNYVSQKARDWLLQNASEWVTFQEEILK